MELEFVGLLFLIIYVGAISVLFLFAVMLFNLKDVVRVKTTSFILTNLLFFIAVAFVFLGLFQYFITQNPTTTHTLAGVYNESIYDFYPNLASGVNEVLNNPTQNAFINSQLSDSVFYLGQILYGRYLLYLMLAGLILLVAMLGAVTLINVPKEQSQMQHSIHQITRSIRITNNK
jgi:NADH-ubiquinone oxidoreductase chain 6